MKHPILGICPASNECVQNWGKNVTGNSSSFAQFTYIFAHFTMITICPNHDRHHFEPSDFTSSKRSTLSANQVVHRPKLLTSGAAKNICMSVGAKPIHFLGVFNLPFFHEPRGSVKRAMRS